jgi:ATP/ADP translocase
MENRKTHLPFGKQNYIIMLTGIVLLILGFIIMSLDTEPFGFGTMGLTLGPIIVMIGFIVEFFAILHKPKEPGTDK